MEINYCWIARHSGANGGCHPLKECTTTELPIDRGYNLLQGVGREGFREVRRAIDADFLAGGGELGECIRLHDWAATPLGRYLLGHTPCAQIATGIVNNSTQGAMYNGVAVLHADCCVPYVATANFSRRTG